jgi:DNA mismatch repair protein MutL
MSKLIKRLSNEVACQIAAGEVIERPVSVVKELLENAIDAGATEIEIHIQNGGLDGIRIEDNGQGIWEEDLPLAIAPHATSKLLILEDLYHIHSKGFRGEALASMASVSRLKIISKPALQAYAMMLTLENGNVQLSPSTRAEGTTIEIKDLFYNVPVRKKFLKSASVEWQAIENMVKRFVMGAPHIAFRLTHDGEELWHFPVAHIHEEHLFRIQKIWGKTFQDPMVIDIERLGMRLWGWLGQPQAHRSQNDRIWVYLNQRVIQDKLIFHALKQVYGAILPLGRFPQCVLFLEIEPHMVDINVHPAKHEVRFEQPRLIYDFLLSSLKPHWHVELIPQIERKPEQERFEEKNDEMHYAYRAQPWMICHADYIILPISFHLHYLVNVRQWWLKKIQSQISVQAYPWTSRMLTMPVVKDVPKIADSLQVKIAEHARNHGIDLQFWGEQRICIRGIPQVMPQLNLNHWLAAIKSNMSIDDLSISHLLNCCQYSAYDITQADSEMMIAMIMNPSDPSSVSVFARCLDTQHCQKVFQ